MRTTLEEEKAAIGSRTAGPRLPCANITFIINCRKRGHETLINFPSALCDVAAEVMRQTNPLSAVVGTVPSPGVSPFNNPQSPIRDHQHDQPSALPTTNSNGLTLSRSPHCCHCPTCHSRHPLAVAPRRQSVPSKTTVQYCKHSAKRCTRCDRRSCRLNFIK
jgi:hypothetical protein